MDHATTQWVTYTIAQNIGGMINPAAFANEAVEN